jgi:hypothetical protein
MSHHATQYLIVDPFLRPYFGKFALLLCRTPPLSTLFLLKPSKNKNGKHGIRLQCDRALVLILRVGILVCGECMRCHALTTCRLLWSAGTRRRWCTHVGAPSVCTAPSSTQRTRAPSSFPTAARKLSTSRLPTRWSVSAGSRPSNWPRPRQSEPWSQVKTFVVIYILNEQCRTPCQSFTPFCTT